jgi:cyclic 2,3-diphosphoglycerate synthetase
VTRGRRAIVVVDGEHYPDVVRDALDELELDALAVVVAGGTEKLRGDADYGVPQAASLETAIAELAPDVVFDLSDEPVLGPVERMAMASRALALGVPYEGADFRFEPPAFEPFEVPSLAVLGTGKRVGKTAVTGHLARALALTRSVVVVAMGRGGPREPELVDTSPSVDDLLALSRAGRHAASDHLETAALAGVTTVGCRRAGGGLAGAVGVSNVLEGARLAARLRPDLVVFDGSGAALPPVATGARVLVVGGGQDTAVVTGYLNAYRHLIADLVVLTASEGAPTEHLRAASRALVREGVSVVAAVLRPRPLAPVAGKRVAFFGAAPLPAHASIGEHLRIAHGADVVHVSGALADRGTLRAELERVDADVFLVELKAAAIDVVAEEARARDVELVLVANDVFPLPGEPDLDGEFERLAAAAQSFAAEPV